MRLLLDAHPLLWWLANSPSLSEVARGLIADATSTVFVSAATVWEIAIKQNLGKLQAPSDIEHQMESHQFVPLPITVGHALAAGFLPRHHDDPFDRMIVAQAAIEGLTIVTRDPRISQYDVPTLAA